MNASANSNRRTPGPKTTVAPVTVIRFGELVPDWGEYHESRIDGNHRAIYRYIGGIAGQILRSPLPGWDFSCGVAMTPPQNGAPLHDHPDEEIFMVWEGEFEIYWENIETKAPQSVTLGKYDLIRVPSGVMRGFRNVGGHDGFLHFIHGQGDYQYPRYHESLREGLPDDARTEPYVKKPAYDPATQLVRFEECPRNWSVYHEARLPEGVRSLRRYIGGVSGDTDEGPPPSLSEGEIGYAMVECGNGRGAPLHDHPCEELFIPLEGRWVVYWMDERERLRQAVLDPWDACWVPAGVQRGFRNADRTEGKIHIIQGQGSTPAPDYAEDYSALRENAAAK